MNINLQLTIEEIEVVNHLLKIATSELKNNPAILDKVGLDKSNIKSADSFMDKLMKQYIGEPHKVAVKANLCAQNQ